MSQCEIIHNIWFVAPTRGVCVFCVCIWKRQMIAFRLKLLLYVWIESRRDSIKQHCLRICMCVEMSISFDWIEAGDLCISTEITNAIQPLRALYTHWQWHGEGGSVYLTLFAIAFFLKPACLDNLPVSRPTCTETWGLQKSDISKIWQHGYEYVCSFICVNLSAWGEVRISVWFKCFTDSVLTVPSAVWHTNTQLLFTPLTEFNRKIQVLLGDQIKQLKKWRSPWEMLWCRPVTSALRWVQYARSANCGGSTHWFYVSLISEGPLQ